MLARAENASRAKSVATFTGFDFLGEHRHKGGIKRALGKKSTKHIGQGKSHEQRLRCGARSQRGSNHDIAHKSQNFA